MTNENAIVCERRILTADDGHETLLVCWQPERDVRAIIQIVHGLAEHAARYERFALECVTAGFAVVAHNHRGHGESCSPEGLGHYSDKHGWDKVINDVLRVQHDVMERYPDKPIVLMGHSMGSFVAQCFSMRNPGGIKALVLSGSTWPNRMQLRVGKLLATIAAWLKGPQAKSEFLNSMSFGDFNKRFAPNRTEFDWLSRDDDEVDKYVADPLCGANSSNQLWRDFIGGMLQISTKKSLRRIADIPILIMGGEFDPVGGSERMAALASAYQATGHSNVSSKIYADGRHEMLNETNRGEVTEDVIQWCSSALEPGRF